MQRKTMRGVAFGLLAMSLMSLMFVARSGYASSMAINSTGSNTLSQYRAWVEDARTQYPYPQSADKMWRVMMCESGGNPGATSPNGRYLGLFQYAPSTWGGRWNPYRSNSLWDAKSQIYATAKAWSIGMQGQWSCYFITAGR